MWNHILTVIGSLARKWSVNTKQICMEIDVPISQKYISMLSQPLLQQSAVFPAFTDFFIFFFSSLYSSNITYYNNAAFENRSGIVTVQCFKVKIVVVMSMYIALILCFSCASI